MAYIDIDSDAIDNAFNYVDSKELLSAISALKDADDNFIMKKYGGAIKDIDSEYKMLLSYVRKGINDPDRENVRLHLLRKLKAIICDADMDYRCNESDLFRKLSSVAERGKESLTIHDVRQQLESYVSSVTMLDLESEDSKKKKSAQLHKEHYQFMNKLFNRLLLSYHWSKGDADEMLSLLLTPTIDSKDQQLIVSAITLNVSITEDYNKYLMLTELYEQAEDVHVRQRALAGWLLTTYFISFNIVPAAEERLKKLMKSENVRKEVIRMQELIFICVKADEDSEKVHDEIIPDLMKNPNIRLTQFGAEEINDDLAQLINPEEMEKAREKAEEVFDKIRSMQKKGSDIYFGEFSQLKKIPFFREISNWFRPFDINHPLLANIGDELLDSALLSNFKENSPFCDSDTYSFVLMLPEALRKMPKELSKQILETGLPMPEEEDYHSTARNSAGRYLKDLYRFYRLFEDYDDNFKNLFDDTDQCEGEILINRAFLATDLSQDPDLDRIYANHYLKTDDYAAAAKMYGDLMERYPEDVKYLKLYARSLYACEKYKEAAEAYKKVVDSGDTSFSVMKKYGNCLSNMYRHDEALKVLYKLNYEKPDDLYVLRMIAWNHLGTRELEKAEKIYKQLCGTEETIAYDWVNGGLCSLLSGDTKTAIERFSEWLDMQEDADNYDTYDIAKVLYDEQLLRDDISKDEILLIAEAMLTETE